MDREEIIRMAREAGFSERDAMGRTAFLGNSYDIERFAALVAAAECDRMCEQFGIPKELAYEKATGNEAD